MLNDQNKDRLIQLVLSKIAALSCNFLQKIKGKARTMLCVRWARHTVLMFFKKAIGSGDFPQKVNIDKSGSNTVPQEGINSLFFIFGLWHLLKYTLGFKSFEASETPIAGIELHRMLKKEPDGQCRRSPSLETVFMSLRLSTSRIRASLMYRKIFDKPF